MQPTTSGGGLHSFDEGRKKWLSLFRFTRNAGRAVHDSGRSWISSVAMRLFTAIALPPDVCAALVAAQGELRQRIEGRVAWVEAKNMHVTMKFLGEVADAEVMKVC